MQPVPGPGPASYFRGLCPMPLVSPGAHGIISQDVRQKRKLVTAIKEVVDVHDQSGT